MKLLQALRWLALVGLVLFGAQRIRSLESPQPAWRLLHRLPLAQIELPADWFSLRELQLRGDPYWGPTGGYVLPTEKVSGDLLVARREDLAATFLEHPVAGAGEVLEPPPADALVLRWEHGSGMLEVLHADWLLRGDLATPATVMGRETVHEVDPLTGQRPRRSERPPRVQRWVPAWDGGEDPLAAPIHQGPGYLEVYGAGGLLFAAGGDLEHGPDGRLGWLHVALDLRGDLYFWFVSE